MADEAIKLDSQDIRSLRTVFLGSCLIFWILAIFIIVSLQNVHQELQQVNRSVMNLMTITGGRALDSYELVAADPQDISLAKVAYRFRAMPQPVDEAAPGGASPAVAPEVKPAAPAAKPEVKK